MGRRAIIFYFRAIDEIAKYRVIIATARIRPIPTMHTVALALLAAVGPRVCTRAGLHAPALCGAYRPLPRPLEHRAPRAMPVANTAAVAMPMTAAEDEPVPWPALKLGSKVLNLYSVAFLFINLASLVVAYPLLLVASAHSLLFDRKRRRAIDMVVKVWAKLCLLFFLGCRPKVTGAEHLPPATKPALLTPNHCSFLDIFALSAALPRSVKYVSKAEILRIPFIGWAMQLAGHIALRRADRKSQLQTFRDSVQCLKDGNALVRARAHAAAERRARLRPTG